MPNEIEENLEENLEERVKELEKTIEKLKIHQHLGIDGSKELSENTRINAKEITIHGAGTRVKDFVLIPFTMFDAKGGAEKPRRFSGGGIYVTGDKETATEQIHKVLSAGKVLTTEEPKELVPSNRADFNKVNTVQLFLTHVPQGKKLLPFPPFAFLWANRTPIVASTGTITKGANTLTDSSARFDTNKLAGSILNLGELKESRQILSNTENVITLDDNWEAESGSYDYEVITPIFLGSANYPFTRLYVANDIRLGYGASDGTQVRYIKWGAGSPEGVVTANPGSLYLNISGGGNTTLYIKESGTQTNTGWVAK